jgi:acetyl-CoA C-acetyltransferase
MKEQEVVIVGAARTAIGNYGGALIDIPAHQLAATAIKAALKRAGVRPARDPECDQFCPAPFKGMGPIDLEKKYYDWDKSLKEVNIDEVIIGNVLQAGQGQNPARQAMIYAGINKEVNAYLVNKLCGSSTKSIALAAQAIKCGDADVVIAAGTESMSTVPYYMPKARWGARMFDTQMLDGMVHDGLWETFYNYHMGVTSENIAEKYGISRKQQDEFSLASNQKAIAAIKSGVLKEEIVPVEIRGKKETKLFDTDEHPRDTTLEALGKLTPVFKKDGTVTAGNSSGITDGAAALLIMSAEAATKYGLKPLAYVKAYASGGLDPAYMGLGVVPATLKALKLAGLTLNDIQLFEVNEAFASQSLGVIKELGLDLKKINPNGGGISLGHPIGATGARITVTLVHEMMRKNYKYGLASLCIGGGQGMAIILERK